MNRFTTSMIPLHVSVCCLFREIKLTEKNCLAQLRISGEAGVVVSKFAADLSRIEIRSIIRHHRFYVTSALLTVLLLSL